MRPMPTAARMYSETDVPPIRVDRRKLEELRKKLPEYPEKKVRRMAKQYGISMEEAKQLVYSGRDDIFEEFARKYAGYERVVARILLHVVAEAVKQGFEEAIVVEKMPSALDGLRKGLFAKEAIEDIILNLVENPENTLEDAMKECGIEKMDEEEIRQMIRKIVEERMDFVKERGERAVSPLMGVVMKELRGKVDGATVNKILKEEIEKALGQ